MQLADCTRPLVSALALGAALCLTPALATAKVAGLSGNVLSSGSATVGQTVATSIYTLDVSGIDSNDELGAAINEIRELQIGSSSQVVGIGWDVTVEADDPSWLSEMGVAFGASDMPPVLFLNVGAGDNMPGIKSYSSGGIVDLVGLGFDFAVGSDGKLRMEFHESFVDYPGDWDGRWLSGSLTFEVAPVPEPATYGMLALGLFAVGAAVRRRRS